MSDELSSAAKNKPMHRYRLESLIVIFRWILGVDYAGQVERKDTIQIKFLLTIEGAWAKH